MTGQLFSSRAENPRLALKRAGNSPDPHTHLVLHFRDRGPDVLFRDTRKFGKVRLIERGKPEPRLDRLGPDALGVAGAMLHRATARRIAMIKTVLLDQSVLAGVGNIYADEALFIAGVRPTRRARTLSRTECDRLARAVGRVLRRGIRTGGSSIDDFVQPDGGDGGYQNEFRVYGRGGKPCRRCGTVIRRRVIGQRSSHFCPECQR
jgi:formamidopyrimidine-DNA glycosylase